VDVLPGATFTADASGFPATLVGALGIRIVDANDAAFLARTTAGISEFPAGSGLYSIDLTAPTTAGQYRIIWDDGSTFAAEDLIVVSTLSTLVPSGSDLTTLAAVKRHLKKRATDTTDDDRLQDLIAAYSRAIRAYTDRQFVPAENAATKVFEYDGSGYLALSPFELRAVTSVTLDGAVLSVFSASAPSGYSYRLFPVSKTTESTYLSIALPDFSHYPCGDRYFRRSSWTMGSEVSIVGDWGVGSVPADVELACKIACADVMRNPEGMVARSLGGFTVTEDLPEQGVGRSLPPAARALLGPYRRVR
jgi:hypothetical protein